MDEDEFVARFVDSVLSEARARVHSGATYDVEFVWWACDVTHNAGHWLLGQLSEGETALDVLTRYALNPGAVRAGVAGSLEFHLRQAGLVAHADAVARGMSEAG